MTFYPAQNSDFIGIREIWEERFTTDKRYLDTLFGEIMPHCTHYIAKENGEIFSTISLMPMKFIDDRGPEKIQLRGWYMFGVATKQSKEGNKLASGTIKSAVEYSISKGLDFIFERPANEDLTDFYVKLGFSTAIPKIYNTFNNAQRSPKTILECIRKGFARRFEWENEEILQGLVNLGEIEEHNRQSATPNPIEGYIYLYDLKGGNPDKFSNTYFCFPME